MIAVRLVRKDSEAGGLAKRIFAVYVAVWPNGHNRIGSTCWFGAGFAIEHHEPLSRRRRPRAKARIKELPGWSLAVPGEAMHGDGTDLTIDLCPSAYY
jgi:hypothetical protein